MRRRRLTRGLLVCSMAIFAACGGGKPAATNSSTPPPARIASSGHLMIIAPTPGEVIHGSTFLVKLQLTGGRVVSQTSTNITPDTGHIHVSIDNLTRSIKAGP